MHGLISQVVGCVYIRAGNMGRACWGRPELAKYFGGPTVKLAVRIEYEPIGLPELAHSPSGLGSGQLDWPEFLFFIINF